MSSHVRQPCLRSVHRPQRKVGKRKRLTPLIFKWVPWLGGDRGASGIRALAHSAFVTRQSYFPPRAARSPEGSALQTRGIARTQLGAVGFASAWRRKSRRSVARDRGQARVEWK